MASTQDVVRRMVFVFGSNEKGRMGAGATLEAVARHGAVEGIGFGRQGNSFAIPTKDRNIRTLPLKEVRRYIAMFLTYARNHMEEAQRVTAIGCGLAGFTHEQIAPWFSQAPENCWFDTVWQQFLGPQRKYWGTYDEAIRQNKYSEAYQVWISDAATTEESPAAAV